MTVTLELLQDICQEDGVLIDPSELKRLAEGIQKRTEGGKALSDVIAVFCAAWKARYGSRPDLLGKDRSLLKGLAKDLGAVRSTALIQHYLTMDNPWFVQQQHDVTTLHLRHRTVSADMEGRAVMTRTQAVQAEKSATAKSQLDRIKRGEL